MLLLYREGGKGFVALPASLLATQPPPLARGSGNTLVWQHQQASPPGKVTPPPPGPRGDRPQTGGTPLLQGQCTCVHQRRAKYHSRR